MGYSGNDDNDNVNEYLNVNGLNDRNYDNDNLNRQFEPIPDASLSKESVPKKVLLLFFFYLFFLQNNKTK